MLLFCWATGCERHPHAVRGNIRCANGIGKVLSSGRRCSNYIRLDAVLQLRPNASAIIPHHVLWNQAKPIYDIIGGVTTGKKMITKRERIFLAWLAVGLGLQGAPTPGLVVDADLPAGNIIVERVADDVVKLRQDLRDSGMWFYWAFRVRGASGRTVKFEFTEKTWGGPVGVRGPVVSTDGGKTFSYPLDGKSRTDSFTYTFGPDEDDVQFYECHPYVRANWEAFVAKHSGARGQKFVVETLCLSRKGAEVPRARFGCIAREPKFRIFMSARHHCSETMASWVLEVVGEAFLADDDLGRWLCGNVELMMVPFVDYDGTQAGDQGKVRKPHDHNRDYSEFLYPETKAITEWIGSHAGGRLDVFIDVHCPWVRGKYNEWLYTPWKDPKILPDVAAEKRFSQLLEKLQCGTMRYRAADDLPFGKEWNKGVNYSQGWSGVIWVCHKVKGLKIARSYEVPFANANGAVVTPETCRDLGRDTAKVFRAFLDAKQMPH